MSFDAAADLRAPCPDQQFEQRLDLLNELGLGAADAEFDALAADLAAAAEAPYAMVNLMTHQQVFAGLYSQDGMPEVGRTMPPDHGYCPEVVQRRTALVLPDVCAHPRFASNPVVDQIGIRTYAGAPLIHNGTVLGTVCFVGTTPRPLSTGQASLTLIKARRETLMELIRQRIHRAAARHGGGRHSTGYGGTGQVPR